MKREMNPPERGKGWADPSPWPRLESVYRWMFSEANITILKRWAIRLSIAGFAIHLLLIFLARSLAHPPALISAAGQNYLSAISTPFNFILFYEVLTLIATLADSTTRSIAGQFEVVSLIFIRDVFHDIAATGNLTAERHLTDETLALLVHMWAGLLMFLLVAVFRHVALRRARSTETTHFAAGLVRFISQKKAVSIGLTVLLLLMAGYNLALFAGALWISVRNGAPFVEPPSTFYNDLFTVMIFTDVLILILSLAVSGMYEMVFRNAAFVVAIILIRFSLTETYPFGAALAVMAMAFSILIVVVFNYHARLTESAGG